MSPKEATGNMRALSGIGSHFLLATTYSWPQALTRVASKLAEAEKMYSRALAGYQKAALLHTIPAHDILENLGILSRDQGKLVQASRCFSRQLWAVEGC